MSESMIIWIMIAIHYSARLRESILTDILNTNNNKEPKRRLAYLLCMANNSEEMHQTKERGKEKKDIFQNMR